MEQRFCGQCGVPAKPYDPGLVDAARTAGLAVDEATRVREQAAQERKVALVGLQDQGLTLREIANAVGLSYQRVGQILAKGGLATPGRDDEAAH